jgi:hypothetical protein
MRNVMLTFAFVAALLGATFQAFSAFPLAAPQRLPLSLQRQGSCTELPQFGVNIHPNRAPDDVNLNLISESRAQAVRFDIPWMDVERQGIFQFARYDNLISKLRRHGETIILILAYGHPDHSDGYARDGFPLPPSNPEQRAAYARFAQAVAQRYHGGDIVYEIWNEPNFAFFWPPAPDADSYGKLLTEAVNAIRQVVPTATIVSGGLANENNPSVFLNHLATAGALDGTNANNFHPYRQDAPENSVYDIAKVESAVTDRAPSQIWLTEWGYSESWLAKSAGDTRKSQAFMVARLMLTAALVKARAALLYDLIDDGTNPGDQESSFGLYDYNFKPKEAATAFKTIIDSTSQCDNYGFSVNPARGIITASFRRKADTSYVIWAYMADRDQRYCFDAGKIQDADLKDIFGSDIVLSACPKAAGFNLHLSDSTGPLILTTR